MPMMVSEYSGPQWVILVAREKVIVLRLNNGATNAIGPKLVEELAQSFLEIKNTYQGGDPFGTFIS